ncbi:hypothetical protein BU23DRAFT_472847, partial [Bimuria novae-zelandiae CBS 107.79]
GSKLYAHKFVVCGKCEYFATAFKGNFKEGEQGFIKLKHGSATAQYRVIEFLYTGDYSDDVDILDDSDLLKDIRVYALAEMFLIDDLKTLALSKFQVRLPKLWMTRMPPAFPEWVQEIYTTTPDNGLLRPEVVRFVRNHRDTLKGNDAFLRLVEEGGDFVVDLFKSM